MGAQVGLGGILLTMTGYPYFQGADIGPQALHSTIIGHGSGHMPIATGQYNVFLGESIGGNLTTGHDNCIMGYLAAGEITTGFHNVVIGSNAMYAGTLANGCVIIGASAGVRLATGFHHTAVGYNALNAMVAGEHCTAVGESALFMATGNDNTGIGANAGRLTTTGAGNVAVGSQALWSNVDDNYNIAIGFAALRLYVGGAGGGNTAVGSFALETGVTHTGCVALGFAAGCDETGSNKLFIDNQARGGEAAARILSLVYGIFAPATANQRFWHNSRLGILLSEVMAFANNAAAAAGGLAVGEIYRTNADPSVLCIRSA